MSLRPAIPWRFALQHGPPPLHRPVSIFRPSEVICQPFPSGKYQNWTRRPEQGKISTSRVGQIRVSKWARPEYQTQHGSYNSALANSVAQSLVMLPPAIKTLPLWSKVAVCDDRAAVR